MQRAGRAGGTHGGRPGRPNLPFDIDPELADIVDQAEGESRSSEDDFQKDLFPDLTDFIMSAPITPEERRGVHLERELQAKRRAGPFWTGTREEWAELDARSGGGDFNPFEGVATYGKKRAKKPFQLANLKRIKVCYSEFLPKELRSVVADGGGGGGEAAGDLGKKRLGLATKSVVDILSKLEDEEVNGNANDDGESDNEGEKENEEDDFERSPEDDDFEEDEDADDDYNAEKYFDDGENDFDDGGDDHGDEGF